MPLVFQDWWANGSINTVPALELGSFHKKDPPRLFKLFFSQKKTIWIFSPRSHCKVLSFYWNMLLSISTFWPCSVNFRDLKRQKMLSILTFSRIQTANFQAYLLLSSVRMLIDSFLIEGNYSLPNINEFVF